MGACWCKDKIVIGEAYSPRNQTQSRPSISYPQPLFIPSISAGINNDLFIPQRQQQQTSPDPETVDMLVLETLGVIGFLVDK